MKDAGIKIEKNNQAFRLGIKNVNETKIKPINVEIINAERKAICLGVGFLITIKIQICSRCL